MTQSSLARVNVCTKLDPKSLPSKNLYLLNLHKVTCNKWSHQFYKPVVLNPGVILPSIHPCEGHLEIPGGIFGCHEWSAAGVIATIQWVEAQRCCSHPVMHKKVLPQHSKELFSPECQLCCY